jgi:NhaP-type Na+/H+ or K+/H+ antiporter
VRSQQPRSCSPGSVLSCQRRHGTTAVAWSDQALIGGDRRHVHLSRCGRHSTAILVWARVRTTFQVVAFLLLGLGVPIAVFGLLSLICSWLTPDQPPPSLNEGQGLADLVGRGLVTLGGVCVLLGVIIVLALRTNSAPGTTGSADWLRRHRRLW